MDNPELLLAFLDSKAPKAKPKQETKAGDMDLDDEGMKQLISDFKSDNMETSKAALLSLLKLAKKLSP